MTNQKIAVSKQSATLSAADLAKLGLAPIPVRAREKRPVEAGWQNASIDAKATDRHIARGGNVGLRMGPQPDGRILVAIDDDEPGAIAAAEAELGALPATLTNRTAKGHHRIFEWPAERAMPANAVRVRRGIDVRAAGGQIVVAPSLHPSGHRYEWAHVAEPVALPDAWVEALATRAPREKPAAGSAPRSALGDRVARVIGVVYPHYAAGGRHTLTRALGSWLHEAGFEDSQVHAVIEALPSEQTPKRVRDALDAAAQKRDGVPTIGWNELAGRLGEDAARLERAVETPFGRRRRERQERAQAANDVDPGGTPGTEPPPLDPSEDAWDAPEVPIDWYCKALGIAPSERKVTLLAGNPGSGKGPLAGHLAISFALGLLVLGAFPCKRCNVGILDYEGKRLTMRRIRGIARGLKRNPAELKGRIFVRDCDPGAPADLHEWIAARKIEVLIVDSYMSAMASTDADPNSSEYAQLARELGKLGIVVIVIAHARKQGAGKAGETPTLGDVAGSYALAGMAATAIAVWNPDDDDRTMARVKCLRAPDEAFPTFDVRWSKDQTAPDDAPVWMGMMAGAAGKHARAAAKEQTASQTRDQHLTEAANRLLAFMARNPETHQSARALRESGVHARDVTEVLAALLDAGMVDHQPSYNDRRHCGTWWPLLRPDSTPPRVVFEGGKARDVSQAPSAKLRPGNKFAPRPKAG